MFNQIIVIGNLGKDPEVRYTEGGDAVANLSLATSESWKDKEGNKQERTEWHRIVVWGKLAEIVGKYLKKGSTAMFQGKIRTKTYEKDGVKHYQTEIIADTMKMLGGTKGRDESGGEESSRPAGRTSKPAAKPAPAQRKLVPDEDLDDDIPF